MKKNRMLIMLLCVGLLFGAIFLFKAVKHYLVSQYMSAHASPVMTVSSMKTAYDSWETQLKASGSTRAVQGVNVTTELAGMVKTIYFIPGSIVKKGDLLVQLNVDPEMAQLESLKANAALAKINYDRDKAQYLIKAVSKSVLDTDEANLKSAIAAVNQEIAIIAQKTVRAPFSGRLGISYVNPGQYVMPGDKITMLQTLDPIYVDFYVPQQSLFMVDRGQDVKVIVDALPGKVLAGKITTIDPGVDATVRNVQVEATLKNPSLELAPGMFVSVTVNTGKPHRYLTLPQSAISFNPYGEIVYVIEEKGKDKTGKALLIAKQHFIVTGEKRGDQITVLEGLKEGDTIVSSGQLKLKNGSAIVINNTILPENNPTPRPVDE